MGAWKFIASCCSVPTIWIFFLLLGGTVTVTDAEEDFATVFDFDSPTVVDTEKDEPNLKTPSIVNSSEMVRPVVVDDDQPVSSDQEPSTVNEIWASSLPLLMA